MPIYTCVGCQFSTPLKTNYSNHLLTRKHLSNNPTEANMLAPMLAADSPMLATPEPVYTCKYCEQCYKHRSSLSKHIKYSCTKNKDEDLKELVRLMNIQLEQQKNEIVSQSKQIEKLRGKLDIQGSFHTNIKDKYLMIYENDKWILKSKNVLDQMYEDKELMIEEWIQETADPEMSRFYNRYLDLKKDEKTIEMIQEEIKLFLFNQKDLVMSQKLTEG